MSSLLPLRRLPLRLPRRTILLRPYSSHPIPPTPSPPRLPAEQQAEFEALQKAAESAPATTPDKDDPFFQNAKPEFEGDVNPKTGEAGGPKVEPLRWGAKGDWSFNGKVTDF